MKKRRAPKNKKSRASGAACLAAALGAVLVLLLSLLCAREIKAAKSANAELRRIGSSLCALKADGADIAPALTELDGKIDGKKRSAELKSDAAQSIEAEGYELALIFASEPQSVSVTVGQGNQQLYYAELADASFEKTEGGYTAKSGFSVPEAGAYDYEITAGFADGGIAAEATYRFAARHSAAPEITLAYDSVPQGGVNLLIARRLRDPSSLVVTVDYPYEPTVEPTDDGGVAYLPINYMREAGSYAVHVAFDGEQRELSFEVTETEYEVQHLTVSSSTVSSTIGSSAAADEIAERFYVLDSHFDENIYFDDLFIQPLEGSITTEYGIKRYTNNATTPSRHSGIDIAAAEGTPIGATNNGVVLFADWLTMTGYTVMIEHGAGVHSIYYHMSGLACAEGDTVSRGDTIGYVGSTGFATGPHLHFALMVNTVSVSPWYAFDGTSGIYDMKEAAKREE